MFPSGLCESSTAHGGCIPTDTALSECQPASGWPS